MASVQKTLTKTSEARYVVRYRDPAARSRERWFARKVDADQFARTVEVDKDRGEYIDPRAGRVTVAEWMAIWSETRVHLRPSTIETQGSLARNHIVPTLGERPLGQLRPSDIRLWVADMMRLGLSASTIRATKTLLSGALEAAANDRLIPRNPTSNVDLPAISRSEMRVLDPPQIVHLAETIDRRYRTMVLTAANAGLRWGEAAALRTTSVNLLRRTLTVSESLSNARGGITFGPPKTRRSQRSLALPRFLCDEIATHLSDFGPGADDLLFVSPEGGPLRRGNWRRRVWKPAVANSVGEPLRFHDLRHTHAALLVREGQHPKVIQERLGHASIKTTLDTYGHLFDGLDEAAADALDLAFCGVGVGLSEPSVTSIGP